MNIRIRRLEHHDVDDIYDIESACFSAPWSRRSLEDALTDELSSLYGAFLEGSSELAGFINTMSVCGELTVNSIAVKESFRRCGIAEKLFLFALTELSPKVVFLEARASNTAAIELYRKLGFEQISVRRGYYSSPKEDALIMRLVVEK